MSRIERLKDEVRYVEADRGLCLTDTLGHSDASSNLWCCRRPDIEVLYRSSRRGQNPPAATDTLLERSSVTRWHQRPNLQGCLGDTTEDMAAGRHNSSMEGQHPG